MSGGSAEDIPDDTIDYSFEKVSLILVIKVSQFFLSALPLQLQSRFNRWIAHELFEIFIQPPISFLFLLHRFFLLGLLHRLVFLLRWSVFHCCHMKPKITNEIQVSALKCRMLLCGKEKTTMQRPKLKPKLQINGMDRSPDD